MRTKAGVDFSKMQAPLAVALLAAIEAYRAEGHEAMITSCCDGKHSANSLHYVGRAFDFRTKAAGIDQATAGIIASRMRTALGEQFDVVVESDHLHVEYDPKPKAVKA